MSKKIGVIVEGPTDKDFFDKHLKKQYPDMKRIKVISSATARNQKIRNKIKLNSRIKDLREKNGCNEIYILIDLDDKVCVVTEKNDFDKKMGLSSQSDVITVVVSTELEAWMMSAWKKSDNATKEDLKKHFGIKGNTNIEEVLLQKFLASKQNLECKNNDSLRYFIEKLGLECK